MIIAATFLFGSLARDEHAEGSDTDLLMVNLHEETRRVSAGHLSLFTYPWQRLESDARDGDLFACHLVQEAKPLLDPDGYLAKLREVFAYRSSYGDEIERAVDLGWYLVLFGDDVGSSLLSKRVLWCVRTILIARSAERGEPTFAPHLLAQQTRSSGAREILQHRHHKSDEASARRLLRSFLEEDTPQKESTRSMSREDFLERFVVTSNHVALTTIEQDSQRFNVYDG